MQPTCLYKLLGCVKGRERMLCRTASAVSTRPAMALRRGSARLLAQALRQQGQVEARATEAFGPSAPALLEGYARTPLHQHRHKP